MKPFSYKFDNLFDKNILEMNVSNIFKNKENREEIIKIMMQTLEQMGFEKTVETMMDESKIWIETVEMKKFKQLIQSSQWQSAIEYSTFLPFQDEKSKLRCKYLVYRHWYFESLLMQDTVQALSLLRNQLKQLASQLELSILSSLVAYSEQKEILQQINLIIYAVEENSNDKKKQEDNQRDFQNVALNSTNDNKSSNFLNFGGLFSSKSEINQQLQPTQINQSKQTFQDSFTYLIHSIWDLIKERKSIPPVNRLNSIIKQAKSYQILKCPVHTTLPSDYSIIENHFCRTKGYPNTLASEHKVHEDEVWHVQFAPNGLYAASICKKSSIAIWRVVKKVSDKTGTSPAVAAAPPIRKRKQIASKEKAGLVQSNDSLLKQTDENSLLQDNLENSHNRILEKQEQKKKRQISQTSSKVSKCKSKEKKHQKKQSNPNTQQCSKVELELVVKKDLDDSSTVQCFSWNQKGNLLVTSQYNKQITVWKVNLDGAKCSIDRVKTLIDSQVEPKSIIFLPEKNDKSVIIYTSDDEFIYMWDYTTETVPKIQCEYDNQSIHLHPNNQDLISVCNQGRISLINLSKKQEVGFFIEKNQIINSNLSSSGSHILLNVIGKQNSINMWNIQDSELESVFTGFKQTDCLLRASMKDEYVAVGDEEGKIFIWHKNIPQKPICIIDTANENGLKIDQYPIGEKSSYESIIHQYTHQNNSNMELESCNKDAALPFGSNGTNEPMNEENKKTINQVHFNPVFPGMLIAAGDDSTVRLFISDEINYIIPEKPSEKKKQSTMETIKQKVKSLIPCFGRKSASKKSNEKKNSQNQIMEEEGEDEENCQTKINQKSREQSINQDKDGGLYCEDEGEIEEEEEDNEEDDEIQECEEEEIEGDEDDNDDAQELNEATEEQKLEQEEGDTSSNILIGNDMDHHLSNQDS